MGKILVKSVLCFAGLAVTSWLLMQLHDLNTGLGNISVIIAVFYTNILTFTLPFLLTIAYTYILFRLFIKERCCYLLVALNGLFILILYIILLFFGVDTHIISYLDVVMVRHSMPVMALALIFKYLSGKRGTPKKLYGRTGNAMLILMKSFTCMCLLAALALAGCVFMELKIPLVYVMFFQEISLLNLLTAIVYTCTLYIFFRRHKHTIWIIAVNSALLLVAWGLIILKIFPVSILFSFICINTALIPPVLALIFRSVERHATSVPANQNAPEDSITPAQ